MRLFSVERNLINGGLLAQGVELEKDALKRLRSGDLRGAHRALTELERRRPDDSRLRQRIEQLEKLIARQAEAQSRMEEEPLRYAHAYVKAGRLQEGLRFLKAAVEKDPGNERIRELARQVETRLLPAQRRRRSPVERRSPPVGSASDAAPPAENLLKELLQRIRQRRRAPSRWLMYSSP